MGQIQNNSIRFAVSQSKHLQLTRYLPKQYYFINVLKYNIDYKSH